MRLLAPRRISRSTESSTSIDTQDIGTDEWARVNGHTIVIATDDLSVSGGVPIRERPGVGPYLTPERLNEWDGIAVSKIDRAFRDHHDFVTFVHDFLEPNDKVLISTDEGIDSSTDMGMFKLGMLVQFAEWELKRMRQRRSDAAKRLRADARWNGGTVNFGRIAVCLCHHKTVCPAAGRTIGWDLVPDPATAPIVVKMADMAIAGKGASAIARWLNDENIPTPQSDAKPSKRSAAGGTKWRSTSVLSVLQNPGLRGFIIQTRPGYGSPGHDEAGRHAKRLAEPRIIRDEDGRPVRRKEILDDDKWYRLQDALDSRKKVRTAPRKDAHPLTGSGFCGKCGAALWARRQQNHRRYPGGVWSYYVCSKSHLNDCCNARGIPMANLDAKVAEEIVAKYSTTRYPELDVTPGVDHSKQLRTIDGQLKDLDDAFKAGEMSARSHGRLSGDLEDLREKLAGEQRPAHVGYKLAADTLAERFLAANLDERREILLALGIKVHAELVSKGNLQVEVGEIVLGTPVVGIAGSGQIITEKLEMTSRPAQIVIGELAATEGQRKDQATGLAESAVSLPASSGRSTQPGLSNADLTGADLSGANLTKAQLANAKLNGSSSQALSRLTRSGPRR